MSTTSTHNSPSPRCPVCGYEGLTEAAYDSFGCASFEICDSCGTEFGYDDATRSHLDLRREWVGSGMKWTSRTVRRPEGWDPEAKLAGFATEEVEPR